MSGGESQEQVPREDKGKGRASTEPDSDGEEEALLLLKERPMDSLGWADLPVEIMVHVFRYLGPREKGRVRLVCREWCELLDATNEELILYPRYALGQEREAIERLAKRQPKVRSLDIRSKPYTAGISETLAAGRALRAFVLHDIIQLRLSRGVLPRRDLKDRFPNLQLFVGSQMDAQSNTQQKTGELLAQWPRLLDLAWSVKDHNIYTAGPSLAFAPQLRSLHLELSAWIHLAKNAAADLERLSGTLQEITVTKVDYFDIGLKQLSLMSQLRSLILQGKASLFTADFEFLKQLPRLQSLILQDFSCVVSGMFKLLPFGFRMLTLKSIGAIWPFDFDARAFEEGDCDGRYQPGETGGAHRTLTHLSVAGSAAGDPFGTMKPLPQLPRLFVYSVMQSHFSRPHLLGPYFDACPQLALVMVTAHEYFHLDPRRCQNRDVHKLRPAMRACPTDNWSFGTSPSVWNMYGSERFTAEKLHPWSWTGLFPRNELAEIEPFNLEYSRALNDHGQHVIRNSHRSRGERVRSSQYIF